MSLSRIEIELLLEELAPHACVGKVQKVLEVDARTLILQLRAPGQTTYLLLCTHPEMTRIHAVDTRPKQPTEPTAFTMLLRKWLHGALVDGCVQLNNDRIVEFHLRAIDPRWEPDEEFEGRAPRVDARLVVELTGKLANMFLLDAAGRVVGQQHADALGARGLHPGQRYKPPPPLPKPTEALETARWELARLDSSDFHRSRAVGAVFEHADEEQDEENLRRNLTSGMRQRVKQLRRRVKNIEKDLSKIENAEEYRKWGELLQGAYGKAERGAKSVRVPDYYREGMPETEVPLDPARSLQDNIDRYFHQYRRYKDAAEQVETRLLENIQALDDAEAALEQIERTTDLAGLEELAGQLTARGLLRPSSASRSAAKKQQPRARAYREFRARSGATIVVGRGARHNDVVTTNMARGRDIWMHARDWAGAHVLLRMDKDDEPKSEDLLDAAILAAHFSQGKNDTVVDVTYTRAKHVRKPKGFGPGMVTVAAGSTLPVRQDEQRLQRLMETEVRD